MGLDISAYSHLRFLTADVPDDYDRDTIVWIYEVGEGFDRLDGRLAGLYEKTDDTHLWWHAEHGTHAVPESEAIMLRSRMRSLRAGMKPECHGDVAVLDEARPITEHHEFRAGSYSGYNWWRKQLCDFALDAPIEVVWKDVPAFRDKPFIELVDFSDCEGSFGPSTSAKLARDFATNAARLAERATRAITDDDERGYFLEGYSNWQRAFELAAAGGFVILH